ncbi:hypothetical protein PM02_19005 [Sulfitobacter mediterraneus]|jgi:hypothetical protein|uniref:Uncharacterized protein n=1 Tax=Sulfitobacter mediterraneus TaxID=83219 RepID=A0A061SKW6_9RHOB|nr:hypothetical protein PM02_19005 [Sulfitobacter mediterraneus]
MIRLTAQKLDADHAFRPKLTQFTVEAMRCLPFLIALLGAQDETEGVLPVHEADHYQVSDHRAPVGTRTAAPRAR